MPLQRRSEPFPVWKLWYGEKEKRPGMGRFENYRIFLPLRTASARVSPS